MAYSDKAISFLPLYALVLLVLFSLGAMFAARLCIQVEEWVDRTAIFKDENLLYSTKVTNRGIFHYPELKVLHFSPEFQLNQNAEAPVAVLPRSVITQRHGVRFPYRGIYHLGIEKLTVTDFLGLFRHTFPAGQTKTIAVYPKVDPHFTLPLQNGRQDRTMFQFNYYTDNYGDVTDLRKYVPSDDYKKIHWKLTAKRGELIVKDFQSAVQNKTELVLDTRIIPLPGQEKAAFEDRMVSFVASATYFCALNQLPVEFVYGSDMAQRAIINPSEDPNRVFHLLAEIPFAQERSTLPAFYRTIDRNSPSTDMVLFLSYLDEELEGTIRTLSASGHNLILFYFSVSPAIPPELEELLERLQSTGVTVHKIKPPHLGEEEVPA